MLGNLNVCIAGPFLNPIGHTTQPGLGLLGNLVIGVVGALLGGFVFGLLGISVGSLLGSLLLATASAIALLLAIRVFQRA
jgi:uncharacterized membrane protein YeaQ/YmgE (transglycosylase-associated protein family)